MANPFKKLQIASNIYCDATVSQRDGKCVMSGDEMKRSKVLNEIADAVRSYHGSASKDIQAGTAERYGRIRKLEDKLPDLHSLH